MLQGVGGSTAHLYDQADPREQDTVVLLVEQLPCGGHKHLHQVRHLTHDTCCTQRSLRGGGEERREEERREEERREEERGGGEEGGGEEGGGEEGGGEVIW